MPPLVRGLWTWWKGVAHEMGDFQARMILTTFYFSALVPFAALIRVSGKGLRPSSRPGWHAKAIRPETVEAARQQS